MEIELIWNDLQSRISVEKKIYLDEPGWPLDIENRQRIGAATDGDPVLYERIFYLVQFLLEIKAKFTPPLTCR